jgi:hypothetical protein
MYKKMTFCVCLIIVSLTCNAYSEIVYNQWSGLAGTTDWNTAGNWALGYVPDILAPNGTDNVKAGFKTATGPVVGPETTNAAAYQITLGGVAGGILTLSGGSINIPQYVSMAVSATENGTLAMNSGTFTIGTNLYVGQAGTAVINMTGGNIDVTGNLSIADTSASTGTVNLNGGTITAADLLIDRSTGATGRLNIAGGTLILTGDKTAAIDGFVSSGFLVAYNGIGTIVRDYDITNSGKTTVTANLTTELAHNPNPTPVATDVHPSIVLVWMPGDSAVTHDIYFGTDANTVLDANLSTTGIYQGSQIRDANSFEPPVLELGKKYYWRVDEVDADANVYTGNLWQFTVADYALVDDFEKYADSAAMLASWSGGGTGAVLSLVTTGGHDKPRTMKFDYNNSSAPLYSEAQIADIDSNWAVAGVLAIDIWYKGAAGNAAEPMYAAIEDNNSNLVAIVVNDDALAVQATDWQVWRIKLTDFAPVNLANIKNFYLGFGSRTNPASGGSGTVYFDDIRLHPTRCIDKSAGDFNNDCVVDFRDFVIIAENWTG